MTTDIKTEKLKEVQAAIPHREPFLFVDEIIECNDKRIVCKKTFTGNEDFFRGHYPGAPLVPGVLQCEAALQAGAILLTRMFEEEKMTGRMPVVAKISEVRFKQMIKPGDTIIMDVKFREKMTGVYFLHAKVTKNDKTCVQFDFACALTESLDGSGVN
ncbi:MAG: 3-hydroxyacyl-ACP dehydratase FabZ [Planctomycetaceae bacterium]|jgi:3-hydroxyacyl-[acyl-carrier-protein] dehydratase|nr:3-hydroxyacyl-ACP dehydratase FabZ [Planctomycetaceae bacterium]